MKTTIIISAITSAITAAFVTIALHSIPIFGWWFICGFIAYLLFRKYCPNLSDMFFFVVFTLLGPFSLIAFCYHRWETIRVLIPFKFQSPITKVKSNDIPE